MNIIHFLYTIPRKAILRVISLFSKVALQSVAIKVLTLDSIDALSSQVIVIFGLQNAVKNKVTRFQ